MQSVFELIKQVERVPKKFLEHLTGTNGLYKIRVEYQSNTYNLSSIINLGFRPFVNSEFQLKILKQ